MTSPGVAGYLISSAHLVVLRAVPSNSLSIDFLLNYSRQRKSTVRSQPAPTELKKNKLETTTFGLVLSVVSENEIP